MNRSINLDSDVFAWLNCSHKRVDERANKILRMVMEFDCRRQSLIVQNDPSDIEDLEAFLEKTGGEFWEELADWEDLQLAEKTRKEYDFSEGKRASAVPHLAKLQAETAKDKVEQKP